MDGPRLTPDLAEAVERLAQIRARQRELDTEEAGLRDSILRVIGDWPEEWFPVRVGAHHVRLARRAGRLDDRALERVTRLGLAARVPREPALQDPVKARQFPARIRASGLPSDAAEALEAQYHEVVALRPALSVQLLRGWKEAGWLSGEEYAACFRDGRADTVLLIVR